MKIDDYLKTYEQRAAVRAESEKAQEFCALLDQLAELMEIRACFVRARQLGTELQDSLGRLAGELSSLGPQLLSAVIRQTNRFLDRLVFLNAEMGRRDLTVRERGEVLEDMKDTCIVVLCEIETTRTLLRLSLTKRDRSAGLGS